MKRFIIIAIVIFCFIEIIQAQPSGLEILNRVEERFKEIIDYEADALASVEMERLRIPRKRIKIFFKQPDKFHFEAEGFAIMPRAGLGFIPSQLKTENYNIELVGTDTINNFAAYKILLSLTNLPGQKGFAISQVPKFYIWIDIKDYVIRKIETTSFQGRLINVMFEYGLLENKYLLPSNIRVNLENIKEEEENLPNMQGMESYPRRLPRSGTITITFTKYVINQNLPDALFLEK